MTERSEPVPRKGHRPPGQTESQPLRPKGPRRARPERSQAGGGSGFVTVNQRLFAPLQGLDPNSVLLGGYGWLDKTDQGATYHPGLDLNAGSSCNADEGALVVTPLAGVVRAVLYAAQGEGNHVWVEIDDVCCPGPTFFHVDHLLRVECYEGQRLGPGESVGACGRSGGWDCAHAHVELAKGPPAQGYWQWPWGWSRAQVEAAYWNPTDWWNAATGLVYAEGAQPVPPEVVETMSDWELINWVLKTLYDWQSLGDQFNPEGGISKTWVAALRDGHYAGRPRTGERPFGEPNQGVWAEFESGLLVYKQDGTMSWKG